MADDVAGGRAMSSIIHIPVLIVYEVTISGNRPRDELRTTRRHAEAILAVASAQSAHATTPRFRPRSQRGRRAAR